MTEVTITAKRWSGGWELWNDGEIWTQVARLDHADQQVRDYLDTVEGGVDHADVVVTIIPEIGDLANEVRAAREATRQAAAATETAAAAAREVVRKLRRAGFSVSDSSAILGVSRGRVSQLAKKAR